MSFLSPLAKFFAATALLAASFGTSAYASDRVYFKNVQGTWSGAGRIVAGPYKNTRFTCNFSGNPPAGPGMKLSGKCRVGLFTQVIEATVNKVGSKYRGRFLDGAKGKGLDITHGKLRGKKLVLGIKRKKLRGTMVANLQNKNNLNITISVKVNKSLVPFIGLTLKRTGAAGSTKLVRN